MKFFVLFVSMLFLHILDDWVLQGKLGSFKQIGFWKKNAPQKKYRYDYIMALIMHSISWTFCVQLPFLIIYKFDPPITYAVMFVINAVVHGIIDDMKCNKFKINLICDQTVHIGQIIITMNMFIWLNKIFL